MILRSLFSVAAVATLATGCFVESAEDRAPQPGDAPRGNRVEEPSNASECSYALGKGCFSGTVVARHQVPVVIGGLIDTHFTDTRSQVPILGNIPLIGTLFRRVDDTKSREELVLMINPQLIDPREGGADASQQMLKDNQVNGLETMAVGQHIHERLNDHLPAPLPPAAQPAEQTAPTPKKRNLIDWFRRNQPVP